MNWCSASLFGRLIRLEPLSREHVAGLVHASSGDQELYCWSLVPRGTEEVRRYVDTALTWRESGSAVPFAIVRAADHVIVGSTRFWNIEQWAWPLGHERHGREWPDACEIGFTWLSGNAVGIGANTEAKLLLLQHAFEQWNVLRVCFHTDRRNERSRAALERMGATFEGVLRAHRMAADFTPRDSCRYSILADEWPPTKARLRQRLQLLSPESGT